MRSTSFLSLALAAALPIAAPAVALDREFAKGLVAIPSEMRVALGRGCEKPYHVFRPFAEPLPKALDESATAVERLRNHVAPDAR